MAATEPEEVDFNVIVEHAEPSTLESAARELARVFHLDEAVALQVVKSAPILFVKGLSKAEMRSITPKLKELSGKGIEFRVTVDVPKKLPKLNWPIRPLFTVAATGRALKPAFDWEDHAFVCPSCGETFLFKRLGPTSAGRAAPSGNASGRAEPAEPLDVAAEPGDLAVLEPSEGEPAPMLLEEEEKPRGGADVESFPSPLEASFEPAENLPDIHIEGLEPVMPMEEPSLEPVIPPEAPPPETVEAPAETAPAEEPQPLPEPEGDLYNVFLSKIIDRSRQEKAAELISLYKKIQLQEARALTTRLVIPIAKNIPRNEAQKILDEFKKHKIFGRMTKVK
ncbi:MAG: hypothetical protein HY716_07195 [Planctomycetes bacterium]|nr:hypothetical protein [Planctomycetota bacterium]